MTDQMDSAKEELQQSRERFNRLTNLADRLFSLIKWFTNISIAILGYYIALLLQLKFNDNEITSIFSISVMVIIIISISVGLTLNFIYESLGVSRDFAQLKEDHFLKYENDIDKFINAIEDHKFIKTASFKLIRTELLVTQFILFTLSISGVTAYTINVLFF